jgi:hypothetical protein
MAQPAFRDEWDGCFIISLIGDRQHHSVPGQWQQWQLGMLSAFHHVRCTLSSLALAKPLAAAGAATAAPAGGNMQELASSSSSGSSKVKWGYLVDALGSCRSNSLDSWQAFENRQAPLQAVIIEGRGSGTGSSNNSSQQQSNIRQLYADALELCRTVAAAVSLPLVCNNPSCENLEGASEAAAASQMCAGCRCRYCSAACQAADWKRHRRACKRMAAAGQVCR